MPPSYSKQVAEKINKYWNKPMKSPDKKEEKGRRNYMADSIIKIDENTSIDNRGTCTTTDKKEVCCEKCKDTGITFCNFKHNIRYQGDEKDMCSCHNKVEVSECCHECSRMKREDEPCWNKTCPCHQPFVAEKCDSIEKAGVVCKDCSAPPQESKEEQEFNEDARMIDKIEGQESKASWEEELKQMAGPFTKKEVREIIKQALSKAKTEERENTEIMIPIWSKEVAEQARQALLADLVKKVGKIQESAKKYPMGNSDGMENKDWNNGYNSALDQVIKILTPQE